jgi:hypothetical protein
MRSSFPEIRPRNSHACARSIWKHSELIVKVFCAICARLSPSCIWIPYDAKRAKVELLKKRFPQHADRLNGFLGNYYANKEDLAAVYDLLQGIDDVDRNELDRIGMTGRRKRAVARFNMSRRRQKWNFERVAGEQFRQNVAPGDPRALVRVFHEMETLVRNIRKCAI